MWQVMNNLIRAHQRRLEIEHCLPRHRHDIRTPVAGGCEQSDRPQRKSIFPNIGKCKRGVLQGESSPRFQSSLCLSNVGVLIVGELHGHGARDAAVGHGDAVDDVGRRNRLTAVGD